MLSSLSDSCYRYYVNIHTKQSQWENPERPAFSIPYTELQTDIPTVQGNRGSPGSLATNTLPDYDPNDCVRIMNEDTRPPALGQFEEGMPSKLTEYDYMKRLEDLRSQREVMVRRLEEVDRGLNDSKYQWLLIDIQRLDQHINYLVRDIRSV